SCPSLSWGEPLALVGRREFSCSLDFGTSTKTYAYVAEPRSFSHNGWMRILNAGSHRPAGSLSGGPGKSMGSTRDLGKSFRQRTSHSRWTFRILSYSSSRLFRESLPRKQLY